MEQNRKPDVDQVTELLEAHKFKQLKDGIEIQMMNHQYFLVILLLEFKTLMMY